MSTAPQTPADVPSDEQLPQWRLDEHREVFEEELREGLTHGRDLAKRGLELLRAIAARDAELAALRAALDKWRDRQCEELSEAALLGLDAIIDTIAALRARPAEGRGGTAEATAAGEATRPSVWDHEPNPFRAPAEAPPAAGADVPSDDYCDICGQHVGRSSHYHCPNCGERCSMMGHLKPDLTGYSCEAKPNRVARPAEGRGGTPAVSAFRDRVMEAAARDVVQGEDGEWVYWPESNRGAWSSAALRVIADELDCRRVSAAPAEAPPAAEAEGDRMRDALEQIRQWSEAYPLDVFPEPDMQACREKLGDGLYTAMNAHAMRHVITGVRRIVDAALASAPSLPRAGAGWVSVTERGPGVGLVVLWNRRDGWCCMGQLSGSDPSLWVAYPDADLTFPASEFTHWMPLPAPAAPQGRDKE